MFRQFQSPLLEHLSLLQYVFETVKPASNASDRIKRYARSERDRHLLSIVFAASLYFSSHKRRTFWMKGWFPSTGTSIF